MVSRPISNVTVLRLAAAVASGVILVVAFPPRNWWWLAPIAVAAFTLAIYRTSWRASLGLGLVFGLVFFAGLMPWLRVIGWDAWVLLSAFCALFFALMGWGMAMVTWLPWWPVWAATVWSLQEFVRGRVPLGGFPWGNLAFSQTDSVLSPWVSIIGAAGLSFLVALIGTGLAWAALRGYRAWQARQVPVSAVGVVVGCLVVSLAALWIPLPNASDGNAFVTAAVVQGDVPRTGLDAFGQREAVLRNHVNASHHLADQIASGAVAQPALVIWPENSSDIDPYADPQAYQLIQGAVTALNAPTLVGLVVEAPHDAGLLNSGVVWDPKTGPGQTYVKRHPVPFGEVVPFRSLLEHWITRFDRVPQNYIAGTKPGLLTMGPATVGDVICFEVAYDGIVRNVVDGGADVLAVQTNNATYGRTGQVEQQLAMERLRALEYGRSVLVAATSGISAIIAPDGQLLASAPEFTQASLVAHVPLRTSLTIAARLGTAPERGLAALGALAIVVAAVWRRRAPHVGRHARSHENQESSTAGAGGP